VRAHATVTRVLTSADGKKVTGVEYYDAKKEKQLQEASVVVLARLVGAEPAHHAQFRDRQARQRPCQCERLLGKYLTAHFASGNLGDVRRGHPPYMGTIAAQYFSYDLYDKNAHKDKGAFGSTFMVAGSAQRYSALGGVANARVDLFGADLAALS